MLSPKFYALSYYLLIDNFVSYELSIQVVLISGETGSGKTTQVMNLNLTNINNQLKLKGEQCLFS